MQQRPVIGIATQTQQAVAGQIPLAWIMGQQYVRALTEAGAVPWLSIRSNADPGIGWNYARGIAGSGKANRSRG